MCKCICMVKLVDLYVLIAKIMINIVIMVSLIQFIYHTCHTCRPINIFVIIILILATCCVLMYTNFRNTILIIVRVRMTMLVACITNGESPVC